MEDLAFVLGRYDVRVKDDAVQDVTWSHDGEDTSKGFESAAWGTEQLNKMLLSYKGHIGRVEISDKLDNFSIRIFHTAGNEISLNQLNAASKQIFIQVLLKVLRNLGDYNPPVMIDTVMGVIDEDGRDVLMEEYFPELAEQTILLCTTSEIRKDSDYKKLEPFISKTYTLIRNVEEQNTTVTEGYFGIPLYK